MKTLIEILRSAANGVTEHGFCDRSHRSRRSGVTLMETIFAIGVIMTGLLGLAAVIPVASQNAQATLELDRSISESTSAAAAGLAQEFNDLSTIIIHDKESSASASRPTPPLNYGYVPSNNLRSVAWKLRELPTGGFSFAVPGKLDSPGYGHSALGSGLQSAICLDPFGTPDERLVPTTSVSGNAFDASRFPYYSERYGVLSQPNIAVAAGAPPAWPMSPRMWRATLKSPMFADFPPSTAPNLAIEQNHLISAHRARQIFRGFGGLEPVQSADPDHDGRGVQMTRTFVGGNAIDAAADASSEYTWFATLVPPFLGDSNQFRQSIVVVRQRLPPVPQRAGDPLALQRTAYAVTDAEENPSAERLTWIGDAIGFQSGTGGDVLIYGNEMVSDEIKANEWVMLSRQPHLLASGVPSAPTGRAVHRWYRVLRVEESERIAGFVMPGGGTHNVWRRWVTLAGPDWFFQDEVGGNTTPVDDTFCTIVDGAVSVIESEVVLQ